MMLVLEDRLHSHQPITVYVACLANDPKGAIADNVGVSETKLPRSIPCITCIHRDRLSPGLLHYMDK